MPFRFYQQEDENICYIKLSFTQLRKKANQTYSCLLRDAPDEKPAEVGPGMTTAQCALGGGCDLNLKR